MAADPLDFDKVRRRLRTTVIGARMLYLREIGSTNDVAKHLAQEGTPDGTVVVTDHQKAGRGRLGRRWEAPPNSSLLLSVVLRPSLELHRAHQATMVVALAAVDAVMGQTGLDAGLKWPNDIVLGNAKLGGILTELGLDGEEFAYAVVGLGLNVNLDCHELPANLLMPAISLSEAVGRSLDREALLADLLQALEGRYALLQQGSAPQNEWAARLTTLGRPVRVSVGDQVVEGSAEQVDADGALLVRRTDGSLARIIVGDVTLRY